jgi:hypothetical protein
MTHFVEMSINTFNNKNNRVFSTIYDIGIDKTFNIKII